MKTLDRTRPFGTISPPYQGAFYEQDGVYFNHEGHQVGDDVPPPVEVSPAEIAENVAPPPGTPAVENVEPEEPAEDGPIAPAGEDPGIDWDDNWFKIRAVLKDHGFKGSKKAEGIAFCKEQRWTVPA